MVASFARKYFEHYVSFFDLGLPAAHQALLQVVHSHLQTNGTEGTSFPHKALVAGSVNVTSQLMCTGPGPIAPQKGHHNPACLVCSSVIVFAFRFHVDILAKT